MTNLVWSGLRKTESPVASITAQELTAQERVRRWVMRMAIATWLLMAIGSATRVMNAGLACPDWPLCYGTLFPGQQMNLQVFLEWFHRLDAAFIGFSAIGLVIFSWWRRANLAGWVPWATSLALLLILGQGVLGGLTVTELLRFDIVTAHLGMALLFFLCLVVIACLLQPCTHTGTARVLGWPAMVAAGLVYLQSLLGALVGSRWAVHQCLEDTQLCTILYSHIWGVFPPTIATLLVVLLALRTPALAAPLRRLTSFAALLLGLQVLLGIATFKLHLQVEPLTVSHQAVGSALLATLVGLGILSWRDMQLPMTGNSTVKGLR